jgi:hypothetical protein
VEPEALEKVGLFPDCHHPFADPVAWRVAVAACRAFRPDTIGIIGDFADFLAVSAHSKGRDEAAVQFQWEIDQTNAALDEVDAIAREVGTSRRFYCGGNHEARGRALAARACPGLWDMLSEARLLKLAERGWEFVPYNTYTNVGKLHVTHDTGVAGKYAHHQSGAAFEGSVAHGHTHRAGVMYFGSVTGDSHVAAMLGWLGDKSKANYLPEVRKKDWQHGFGTAFVERATGYVHLSFVPIIKGACVVDGALIRA